MSATSKARKASGADRNHRATNKSEQTRQRILDAAAHVLSVNGFAGTRIGDVARKADVHPPAIYYYFDSREDLIEEVMWTGLAHMRQHILTILADKADADPFERIMAATEAHLRFELSRSDYTIAAVRNLGQLPENLRIRYIAEAEGYGAIWKDLIEAAAAAGLIRPDIDLLVARMLLLGALNWAVEWWDPERGDLEAAVRTATSLVRHALGSPG